MSEPQAEPLFPQERFEAAIFHSLGLLEQNREYLEAHLRAAGADADTMQALDDMQTACARLNRSLNEMLALLACIHGTAQPSPHVFDLGVLVRALSNQKEPVQRALGVELALDTGAPQDIFAVYADKEWAEQICLHLLSNALHACDKGGHVSLSLRRQHEQFLLCIADDGCGLPDASPQSQRLNRRHFLGGAQAGLMLCHSYCRLMGWSLALHRRDIGTEAVVTIPATLPVHTIVELHASEVPGEDWSTLCFNRLFARELAEMTPNHDGSGKQ